MLALNCTHQSNCSYHPVTNQVTLQVSDGSPVLPPITSIAIGKSHLYLAVNLTSLRPTLQAIKSHAASQLKSAFTNTPSQPLSPNSSVTRPTQPYPNSEPTADSFAVTRQPTWSKIVSAV
jgi:hypothetical protein